MAVSPGMVTAVAYLLTELVTAGVSVASILKEARENGQIPPERWAELMNEINMAEDLWDQATAGRGGDGA